MRKTEIRINAQEGSILSVQARDALKMHMIWMDRGYSFLKGTPVNLPPGFAANDELCPVGNWLRERLDPRFRALALFERTNKLHDEFHRALDQLFGEDITNVRRPVENRFREVGDELTRALEEWIDPSRTLEQTQ